MNDPIVEDVRQIRDEHAARFNYDVELIVADLKKSEAERDWPRASFAPRRVHRPVPGGGNLSVPDKP
jgi:hypothetical protein